MIRRLWHVLALSILITACSSGAETTPSSRVVTSPPTPVGSPQAATPTAMLALPAPPPSPVPSPPAAIAEASPSPAAVAASPVAASPTVVTVVASPAALGSPVPVVSAPVTAAQTGGATTSGSARYLLVQDKTEALYRARETFVNQPAPAEAVGRTNDVEGEIVLDGPGVLRGQIVGMRIDLRTLVSDQTRRDNFIKQNTLQTDQHPYAEFRSTEAAGPGMVAPGQEVSFQVRGLMTIKGRERPITWEARARLDGSSIIGSARARIKLTDFGLEPPRLAILSVEDEMTWEIELVAERAP